MTLRPVFTMALLTTILLACGDDSDKTPPPAQFGEACAPDDGPFCDEGFYCEQNDCRQGSCMPRCQSEADCPMVDGLQSACGAGLYCYWPCETNADCPTSLEVTLDCVEEFGGFKNCERRTCDPTSG